MQGAKWIFVGAGNMASSLIGGLVASGVSVEDIAVVDISQKAIDKIKQSFGVRSINNIESIDKSASVVIAVKPNLVENVCKALAARSPNLVISVAAGVRSDSMSSWLPGHTAIVRCMPNTPALLGLGATALFANSTCTDAHKNLAQNLLSTAGKTSWVINETELDAITALSGSGPAYIFYMIEHMAKAAEELGLDEVTSREFAIETAFGAASMAREQTHSPQVLRENVTSKGGTTGIILKAMRAAKHRAIELGDEFGASS